MLQIRFNRVGKKNKAYFRLVLQEKSAAPGGRHVEILGSWNPYQKKGTFKEERIKEWLGKGVQVSDSVHNLLVKQGIIKSKKRPIKIKKSRESKAAEKEAKTPSAKERPEQKAEEEKSRPAA